MKEELSTAQHAELQVDEATERKHRCWTVIQMAGTTDKEQIKKWSEIYEVTPNEVMEQIKQIEQTK